MLGIAQIRLNDSKQIPQLTRAICDNGSQINLITENCAQRCAFRRQPYDSNIDGPPGSMRSTGFVDLQMRHRFDNKILFTIRFLIVRKVSCQLPQNSFENPFGSKLREAQLADPSYNKPGPIDVLLGAGVWAAIALGDIIRDSSSHWPVVAQNTSIGWVICGNIDGLFSRRPHVFNLREADRLDTLLQRFWESESVPSTNHTRSDYEQFVEDNFVRSYTRGADGRYTVTIPIQPNAPSLGSSHGTALKRFYALEKRVMKDPQLMNEYNEFMMDYLRTGHMVRVTSPPHSIAESYYIPYHIINKKKLRVVFDASCATSIGVSFNDTQLPGEKLQCDLGEIILRFRLHRFAITADIIKMFRQIAIDKSQWDYQRILWRPSVDQSVAEYWLTTVTWGMTSAGYNAVRALRQCALDEAKRYPVASVATLNDFYIDDFLSGGNDYQSLAVLHHQMIQLLRSGVLN